MRALEWGSITLKFVPFGVLLLVACPATGPDEPALPPSTPAIDPDPCAGSPHAPEPDDGAAIWVSPEGSDSASGTRSQPFSTLDHALAVAAVEGPRLVRLTEGRWHGSWRLDTPGITVQGTCSGGSILDGDVAVPDSEGPPTLDLAAGALTLENLTVVGGNYGINAVFTSPKDDQPIHITDVRVQQANQFGLHIGATAGGVVLTRVLVEDTVSNEAGQNGIGFLVGGGGHVTGADVTVLRGTRVGVYVISDSAYLELDGLTVEDVGAIGGLPGAGVLGLQSATLVLSNAVVRRSEGIGIALDGGALLTLTDSSIEDTQAPPAGGEGMGFNLDPGAQAVVSGLQVLRTAGYGVVVDGSPDTDTVLTIVDSLIADGRGTGPGDQGLGIAVIDGGALFAERVTISNVERRGVLVQDAGSTADFVDLLIEGVVPGSDRTYGAGLAASRGGAITVRGGSQIRGVHGAGVHATTLATIEATGLMVLDSIRGDGVCEARGLSAETGSDIMVTDTVIDGVEGRGVYATGGSFVSLDGVSTVTNVYPDGAVDFDCTSPKVELSADFDDWIATGALALEASEIVASGTVFQDIEGIGLLAQDSGSLIRLVGGVVERVHPLSLGAADSNSQLYGLLGRYGHGGQATAGARIELVEGSVIRDVHSYGLLASRRFAADGVFSSLLITDSTIEDVHEGVPPSAGTGIVLEQGATLTAVGATITRTEGPGLRVTTLAEASLIDCVLTDNAFAGIVLAAGAVTMVGGSVSDVRPSPRDGCGAAVFTVGLQPGSENPNPSVVDLPHVLDLTGVTISGTPAPPFFVQGPGVQTLNDLTIDVGAVEMRPAAAFVLRDRVSVGSGGFTLVNPTLLGGDAVADDPPLLAYLAAADGCVPAAPWDGADWQVRGQDCAPVGGVCPEGTVPLTASCQVAWTELSGLCEYSVVIDDSVLFDF